MIKHTQTPSNFIPPVINPDDFVLGSIGGVVLRENGDWRDYLTGDEEQQKFGVETSACATFNTIHPIAILQEEVHGLVDQDYAERFISLLSGTTRQGNSPNKVAQTIRDYGLIPQNMLPFDEKIDTWEKYNSYVGGDEKLCKIAGELWKKKWDFRYEWVWRGDIDAVSKQKLLQEALRFSPVGVSVNAWYENNWGYIKPEGSTDNHWTCLVAFDGDYPIIWDTYYPFIKKLDKNYDFGFAMRYSIEKLPEIKKKESLLSQLFNFIKKCLHLQNY